MCVRGQGSHLDMAWFGLALWPAVQSGMYRDMPDPEHGNDTAGYLLAEDLLLRMVVQVDRMLTPHLTKSRSL